MKLLLDSHIVVAVIHNQLVRYGNVLAQHVQAPENAKFVSAASLWELAIKHRLSKLELQVPIENVPSFLSSLGFELLNIDHHHAIEELEEQPPTRDPFDRLLLAQCQVEGMRLVTLDRALAKHPLAWRDK